MVELEVLGRSLSSIAVKHSSQWECCKLGSWKKNGIFNVHFSQCSITAAKLPATIKCISFSHIDESNCNCNCNHLVHWHTGSLAHWLSGWFGGVLCFWHLAAVATLPHRRHIFPETRHDPITGIRQLPRRVAGVVLPLAVLLFAVCCLNACHSFVQSFNQTLGQPDGLWSSQSEPTLSAISPIFVAATAAAVFQQHCAKIKCCENSIRRLRGHGTHVPMKNMRKIFNFRRPQSEYNYSTAAGRMNDVVYAIATNDRFSDSRLVGKPFILANCWMGQLNWAIDCYFPHRVSANRWQLTFLLLSAGPADNQKT